MSFAEKLTPEARSEILLGQIEAWTKDGYGNELGLALAMAGGNSAAALEAQKNITAIENSIAVVEQELSSLTDEQVESPTVKARADVEEMIATALEARQAELPVDTE
jgi:hypothetical protein